MKGMKIPIIGFLCLVVIIIILNSFYIKKTSSVAVAVVNSKERVVTSSAEKDKVDSKYLVFTDTETFECTDEIMLGKFNSSDVYGKIQAGKKYRFTVYGVRIPFLSTYRNIINAELCQQDLKEESK